MATSLSAPRHKRFNLRIDDNLLEAASRRAAERELSVAALMRLGLRRELEAGGMHS